jgi:1-deoxy-D-xylulose-5-phosphate reductoisomerase
MVHPQSVIHSMVEFVDGSTLAQASPPDMRLPIALGLAWPDRVAGAAPGCDWSQSHTWTFDPFDDAVFPAVRLARQAGAAGGTAPAVFNAANEVAVEAFRSGRLTFTGIVDTVSEVLSAHEPVVGDDFTLAAVGAADDWARERAAALVSVGQR